MALLTAPARSMARNDPGVADGARPTVRTETTCTHPLRHSTTSRVAPGVKVERVASGYTRQVVNRSLCEE
jgi:hypothetical protein